MKKTEISPSQALLILIKNTTDPDLRKQLKHYYLVGNVDHQARQLLTQWFNDPALSHYSIKDDPQTINDDPTRRYFETHLAYESLQYGLANIPKDLKKAVVRHEHNLERAFKRNLKQLITDRWPAEIKQCKTDNKSLLATLDNLDDKANTLTEILDKIKDTVYSGLYVFLDDLEAISHDLEELLENYQDEEQAAPKKALNLDEASYSTHADTETDETIAVDILRKLNSTAKNTDEHYKKQVKDITHKLQKLVNISEFLWDTTHSLAEQIDQNEASIQTRQAGIKDLSTELNTIMQVLNGETPSNAGLMKKEFAGILRKIRSNELFSEFSDEQTKLIETIIRANVLATQYAQLADTDVMPIDIYTSEPIYVNGSGERGKIIKKGVESTRSLNLGIMRSWMPTAQDDISRGVKDGEHVRSADKATYDINKQWPKINFDRQVHPYANSISGSMLCQLRAIAWLENPEKNASPTHPINQQLLSNTDSRADVLENYLRFYISALLYTTGGHSLFEYFQPLRVDPVKDHFATIIEHYDDITLESMFLEHNIDAFDAALQKSIEYNDRILLRQQLNQEVQARSTQTPKSALFKPKHEVDKTAVSEKPKTPTQKGK